MRARSQVTVPLLLIVAVFASGVCAADLFECVRGLLPLTPKVNREMGRKVVDPPFLVNGKFLVFPAKADKKLTGFYVYSQKSMHFYDRVSIGSTVSALDGLSEFLPQQKAVANDIIRLMSQPDNLETVELGWLPGFYIDDAERFRVYRNPLTARPGDLKPWFVKLQRIDDLRESAKIGWLKSSNKKAETEILKPLVDEHGLRRDWIQKNSLPEEAFKVFQELLKGPCA